MSNFADQVNAQLSAVLDQSQEETAQLNNALRLLSKWRSAVIQNILFARIGTNVGISSW
jgi:hypothetical protein